MTCKNGNVRAKIAEYLEEILSEYCDSHIDKHFTSIETGITQSLSDANKDAREHGRNAFMLFSERYPDKGNKMMNRLDHIAKKQLQLFMPDKVFLL